MITINDNDLPITAAQKLIVGTKPNKPGPFEKAAAVYLTGDKSAGDTIDMFDLEEIKEISDYLMVFYMSHSKGG